MSSNRKEYMKKYAKKNKEKLAAYRKAYYQKNKETKWKDDSGWKRNLEYEKEYAKKPEVISRRKKQQKLAYDKLSKEDKKLINKYVAKRKKDPLYRKKYRDYHRKYQMTDKMKIKRYKRQKAQINNLDDAYILKRLQALKDPVPITPDTIELKRLMLQIDREIKNQKQNDTRTRSTSSFR